MLAVVDTVSYKSFKEKEHLIKELKKKYEKVRLSFDENMIIYQYYVEAKAFNIL